MKISLAVVIFLIIKLTAFGQMQHKSADSLRLQALLKTSTSEAVHKDYLLALKHFYQYRRLKDSILDIASKLQFNELQRHYQTKKKDLTIAEGEKNIHLLISQNSLIEKNLRQTQTIRNIIFVVAIVAALLLIISYTQFRLKKQANLRLENQQLAIDQKNDYLQHLSQQKDQLLEEKELLIKEIHHRVKNNLQVVISLLNTQSAYLNDSHASAALRQSQHRMQSISLIHQKLYQSESRAIINMKEYVQELVQYLQQSFDTRNRIRFKLNVDGIELDVLRAVPVGLILNEAITNCLKYAFRDNDSGTVEIGLHCIKGKHLKLTVIDNGPGLPSGFDVDLCKSLGINLMRGMCKQISGTLAMQNKNGLMVLLTFPAEHVQSEGVLNSDMSPFDDDVIAV